MQNDKSKLKIKKLLKKHNLRPNKVMGQNFLIDREVLKKIIEAAELKKTDTVLEIGPGLGILTKKIARTVAEPTQNKNAKPRGKVIAVEKDKELAKILNRELQKEDIKNVKIIQKDILKIENSKLKIENYKLIANLPYYITSPVIRKFLESETPPKLMVLMVQKEVAKRICAKPPKMTLLSIAVQVYATSKIVKIVKKNSFWPKPKVNSAILKIEAINSKNISLQFRERFFKIVKIGFSSPRKQLKNNLKDVFGENTEKILNKTNINKSRRAESLSIKEWIRLAKNFQKN